MSSKKEILARTVGIEDVIRGNGVKELREAVEAMTTERTNVMLSPKDKKEIKELIGTKNLSEAIRAMLRDFKRIKGL